MFLLRLATGLCVILSASSAAADWGQPWGQMQWGLDTDGDGHSDIFEAQVGTDTTDADTDNDSISDGFATAGDTLTAGPDNCPFVANAGQLNSDAFDAGDDCQCGNMNGLAGVDAADALAARRYLMGRSDVGPFEVDLCDLTGDALCAIGDIFLLDRILLGAREPTDDCAGYGSP